MNKLRKISKEELDNILGLHKKWLNNEKGGKKADLSYADLRGMDLSYANLKYAILERANLSHANLKYADLSHTKLTYANLKYAILERANLSHANLKYAKLNHAILSCADLTDTYLEYANLSYTDLYKTNLFYAIIDDMISVGNLGNSHRTAYYFYKKDRVICGCFDGNLQEFEKAVEGKYDKDSNYYVAINTFKNIK